MTGFLAAISEGSRAGSEVRHDAGQPAPQEQGKKGAAGGSGARGGGLHVQVSAGPPALAPISTGRQQYSSDEEDDGRAAASPRAVGGGGGGGGKFSFFRRASRRIRRSVYAYAMGQGARESYYRDSVLVPDPLLAEAAQTSGDCGLALRRRLLPERWQQAVCALCDSLGWHLFVLAITLFAVFAPDLATITSAPDSASDWINGFIIGIMGIFAGETVAYVTCRERIQWLLVFLDVVSNLSMLFAITWFTEALGLRADGTTSDAARACRVIRLVRVASVVELLAWKVRQWSSAARSKAAAGAGGAGVGQEGDKLEPSNIGKRIGEVTTLQVALVVMATVVGTSLLIGADLNSGGSEGLDAFASALAAQAAAGADAAQLQPTIDAMLAFSSETLNNKQVPMQLEIPGVGSWDWVQQQGGWTARSSDRLDLQRGTAPPVLLAVDVQKANHLRARYNMLLALLVISLLLGFVLLLNYTIFKMLVQPLDRIFHTIRTNAAQVVAALGPESKGRGTAGHGGSASILGGASERGSKKDDLDMHTIEAAVEKMSRILEQYTSTGGVGLNTVKKMAHTADQSTKEWLATMVAGPASEEVVHGRGAGTHGNGGSNPGSASASFTSKAGGSGGAASPSSPGGVHFRPGAGGRAGSPGPVSPTVGRRGMQPRQSRLGRMSELTTLQAAALAAVQGQGGLAGDASRRGTQNPDLRRTTAGHPHLADRGSTHHQQQQQQPQLDRTSTRGSLDLPPASPHAHTGSHRENSSGSGSGGPTAVSPRAGGLAPASGALNVHSVVSVGGGKNASLGSVDSDSLAVAAMAAAMAGQAPPRDGSGPGGDAWAGASGSSLSEAQKKLLAAVDLDYLHSFSFDALAVPRQLLTAYLTAMFLELELAFFSPDAEHSEDDEQGEPPSGFVDVATLWAFLDEVAAIYRPVTYHNFSHCVDVTHTTFMFIKRVGHKVALTHLERFALLVAAVSHDLDHPGVNNAFLVNARDDLATTYNDNSVLENRHVACLYGQLLSRPHLDIFARLDPQQWREVRKAVIGAVLSTDMVHHFPMVSRLEVFYELHAATIAAHHRALRQGLPRDSLPRLFDSAEERQLLLNLLLHCADISNPVKPTTIAEKWSDKVLGEFFEQGDRERAAGLSISPMCDRTKTSRAVSQINFIEFVVAPIYAQAYKIFPELGEAVDHLMANRHFWQDELGAELADPGGTVPGTAEPLTPERRVEEQAKADKRLRDFQTKYGEILQRRRHQLERLVSVNASRASLFTGGSGSVQLDRGHQRHGSLQMLVHGAGMHGGGGAGGGEAGGSTRGGGGGSGLLGRIGRTLTLGSGRHSRSSSRGQYSTGSGGGRSSNGSAAAADALAELHAQLARGEGSFIAAGSGGSCLGGGGSSSRVVPEDAV